MKRRAFLQQAGIVVTGTVAAGATEVGKAETSDGASNRRRPTVLLTSPETGLGQALQAGLADRFEIRLADAAAFSDKTGRLRSLLDGASAVIHVAQPAGPAGGADLLDQRARGTYDLLTAASAQGVELVVYLSSLRIMTGYDPSYQVTEDWRPLPTTDAEQLAHHLGEFTCREFARQGRLRVIVLRLGEAVRGDEQRGRQFDPPPVDSSDVVQAVRLAMDVHFKGGAGLREWNVLHIAADLPGGRFPISRAKRILGFQPQTKSPA